MSKETELFTKAKELRTQGHSYQEIADALHTPKASIYRLLTGETERNEEVKQEKQAETFQERSAKQFETVRKEEPNDYNTEHLKLKQKELELSHEREMYKLKQKDKELDIERMKVQNSISERLEKQEMEQQKQERKKKQLLRDFHKLVEKIKEADGNEWWLEEVKEFTETTAMLKEEIERFVSLETDLEPESLACWQILNLIEEFLLELIEENEEETEEDGEEDEDLEVTMELDTIADLLKQALEIGDLLRKIKGK